MTSNTLKRHAGEPGGYPDDPADRTPSLDLMAEDGLRARAVCADLDRLATSRTPEFDLANAALRFLDRDLSRHMRDATEDLIPLLRRRCPPEDEIGPAIAAITTDIETARACLPKVRAMLAACLDEGRVPSASEAERLARFTRHTRRHLIAEKAILLPLARIRLWASDRAHEGRHEHQAACHLRQPGPTSQLVHHCRSGERLRRSAGHAQQSAKGRLAAWGPRI